MCSIMHLWHAHMPDPPNAKVVGRDATHNQRAVCKAYIIHDVLEMPCSCTACNVRCMNIGPACSDVRLSSNIGAAMAFHR